MSAKLEVCGGEELAVIGGRPVLQPACNRVARANEANNGKSVIRKPIKPPPPPAPKSKSPSPPVSPSAKAVLLTIPSKNALPRIQSKPPSTTKQNSGENSPTSPSEETSPAPALKLSPSQSRNNKPAIKPSSQRTLLKRANDTGSLNVSTDKQSSNGAVTPKASSPKAASPVAVKISIDRRKKPRKLETAEASLVSTKPPGSFAAARKAEMSEIYAQRKLKIAHYGRKQGMPKPEKVVPEEIASAAAHSQDVKRCSFITSQSDPAYITYHDEEWGVPVHDDKLLFELLVLMGAQVGMNWPTILSKREAFRAAFAGFDPEIVAGFSEKKIAAISAEHDIMDVAKIRGMVENAKQILEIVQEFGSFDKYIWSFVNYKPIVNKYRHGRHIPVKTSKAETISKDLVKRNFRFVGPTITYSFMQAAGLTNDHLVNCFRHEECLRLAEQGSCN